MASGFRRFLAGIGLVPKTSSTVDSAGEMDFDTSSNKANLHNGTTSSPVVTEAHTATLTNKTLSGNTAATLISGSGTLTLNTTGTVTVPNATDTLVGKATTDTLTNKTLTAPVIATIVNSGTITLPTSTDTLVGKATTDTLSNKTLDNSTVETIKAANFTIQDGSDTSKQAKFVASSISTSTTRSFTLPDVSDTLVSLTASQTLTNKTLTTPVISTISNTGTLTLPTSTDTIVGRATTDTLTNKTLTSPVISTITNTGTITLPTSTDTLVGKATTDAFTNKTFSDAITGAQISTPSNPASGKNKLYFKSDNNLYALTSGGVETSLTAVTLPTNTYFSGYMPNGVNWSTTSSTFADPTCSGSNTLTTRFSNGLTVTAAAGNVAGITFTPASSTSVYIVKASTSINGGSGTWSMQLTDGTNPIDTKDGPNGVGEPVTLFGIFAPGTGSAVTVKVQTATTGGTVFIENFGSLVKSLEWSVVQIK